MGQRGRSMCVDTLWLALTLPVIYRKSKYAVKCSGHRQNGLWYVYYSLECMDPVISCLRKCESCFMAQSVLTGILRYPRFACMLVKIE